ncbi:MAG TPA: methyltransferase domain-containing protein [Acetobacteraceae bacterium]|jgi:predicted SAM-dependent methyltransferase|nr:methyltransferase domain-containing protein [Acetobacteraceae bacterium]
MRLYLGSRDIRPEGFLTVDVDPAHGPDILADVTDLASIASNSVDEICASHILEHIPWPRSFKALAEWARVLRMDGLLRVAVPDLGLLSRMISEGRNVWAAAGLMFGAGRLENPLEAHQYGYTRDMLIAMLRSLGFCDFAWWKHDLRDGSNGWMLDDAGNRLAISLNIAARKVASPVADPAKILSELTNDRLQAFDEVLGRVVAAANADSLPSIAEDDPLLTQHLHMALIEARMRILYLENELAHLPATGCTSPSCIPECGDSDRATTSCEGCK